MNRKMYSWLERLVIPRVLTGTADVDISEAVYTGFIELLNITVPDAKGLANCVVDLDLEKATTGWNAVATDGDTCQIGVFVKVDGTNYHSVMLSSTFTAAAAMASGDGCRLELGPLAPGQDVSIRIKMSAERGDCEIPYSVTYLGENAPTITAVAAA